MLSFTVSLDASCDASGSDFHWKNKCNECNHRVTKQGIQHPCSSHSLLPCEFASKQKHRTIFPCNLNGTLSLSLCVCVTHRPNGWWATTPPTTTRQYAATSAQHHAPNPTVLFTRFSLAKVDCNSNIKQMFQTEHGSVYAGCLHRLDRWNSVWKKNTATLFVLNIEFVYRIVELEPVLVVFDLINEQMRKFNHLFPKLYTKNYLKNQIKNYCVISILCEAEKPITNKTKSIVTKI